MKQNMRQKRRCKVTEQTAKKDTDQTAGYETKWAAEKETGRQNRQQKRDLQSAAMKENKLQKRRHRDRTDSKRETDHSAEYAAEKGTNGGQQRRLIN